MQQVAVDVFALHAVPLEERVEGAAEALLHQGRKLRREDDAEAVVLDVPAHDVFGAMPEVVAHGDHACAATVPANAATVSGVAEHDRRGAVAEERGRHEHRDRLVVDAQAQAAEIDGEEEDTAARHGLGDARAARQPGDTAAAADAEDRQAFDVRREGQAVHQPRVEAWHGQPGDGVDDERVDLVEAQARLLDGAAGRFLEEVEGVGLEHGRPLFPAARLLVPVDRLADVARADTSVHVDGIDAGELGVGLARHDAHVFLENDALGHGSRDRGNLDVEGGHTRPSVRGRVDRVQHVLPPLSPFPE